MSLLRHCHGSESRIFAMPELYEADKYSVFDFWLPPPDHRPRALAGCLGPWI
jgi:hypothetical protein